MSPTETQNAAGSPSLAAAHAPRLWPAACAVSALALAVRCLFIAGPGFPIDQAQFVEWSHRTRADGLTGPYVPRPNAAGRPSCNYPPAYLYVLRGLAPVFDWLAPTGITLNETLSTEILLQRETQATRLAVWLYKTPAVLADALLGGFLVIWLARRTRRRTAVVIASIYACLPVVVHNSTIWGQVDGIPALLIVASLEAARRRNIRWMSALAVLAVLTKAQAAMMLPLWLIVAMRWAGRDRRRWATVAAIALGVLMVVLLPFANVLTDGVWDAYAKAAAYYPYTHLNGFSVWFLAHPLSEPHLHDNLARWYHGDNLQGPMGITARTWGLTALLCMWACVVAALWRRTRDEHTLFWSARILSLAFFVLSTQMHERYLFPAIAIWAWTYVRSPRWWAGWILLGLCATLNVLWVWPGPPDAIWTSWLGRALHRPWLGILPGQWCSLALTALLGATLVGWPGKVRKAAAPGTCDGNTEPAH